MIGITRAFLMVAWWWLEIFLVGMVDKAGQNAADWVWEKKGGAKDDGPKSA